MFNSDNIIYAFGIGIMGSLWLRVMWMISKPIVQKIVKGPDELVSDDKSVPRELIDQQDDADNTP